MPIVFQQPSPVMPNVSMGYGAAEQYSKDLPTLAGMQEAAARLAQSSGIAGQHGQDAYSANAERAREFDLGQRQESNLYDAQLGTQANLAMYHGSQQLAMQQQHFAAQDWVNQQDMTRQESLRMSQIQQTIAAAQEAKDKGALTPQEFDQVVLDAKTPYSMLKAKQVATQTRLEAAQAKKAQADATAAGNFQATVNKAFADSGQAGMATFYDPHVLKQVEAEFDASGVGVENPEVRDAIIKKVAADRGGAEHYIQDKTGHLSQILKPEKKTAVDEQKQYNADFDRALKHHTVYEAEVNKTMKGLAESPKHFDKPEGELRKIAEGLVGMPKPGPLPERPTKGAPSPSPTSNVRVPEHLPGDSAPTTTPPAPKVKADLSKKLPESPKEWDTYQQAQSTNYHRAVQEISLRTDISPLLRKEYQNAIEKAGEIFRSGEAEKKKSELEKLTAFIATLPPAPRAAPPAMVPRAPQTGPGPMPYMPGLPG